MDRPIRISLGKNILQPIAEVVVECEKEVFFTALWKVATNIIGTSYKYEGKLIENKPEVLQKMKIAISFSILFPDNYTRDKFVDEIKQRRGR